MKFKVNTDDFKNAFKKVCKVTGVKTSANLENVKIRKIGYDVHLLASNLEQFADVKVDSDTQDDVEFQFSDTKSLLKAMKFFSEYQIEFDCAEDEITISCGGKKAKQRLLKSSFPKFPLMADTIHDEFEYSSRQKQ